MQTRNYCLFSNKKGHAWHLHSRLLFFLNSGKKYKLRLAHAFIAFHLQFISILHYNLSTVGITKLIIIFNPYVAFLFFSQLQKPISNEDRKKYCEWYTFIYFLSLHGIMHWYAVYLFMRSVFLLRALDAIWIFVIFFFLFVIPQKHTLIL